MKKLLSFFFLFFLFTNATSASVWLTSTTIVFSYNPSGLEIKEGFAGDSLSEPIIFQANDLSKLNIKRDEEMAISEGYSGGIEVRPGKGGKGDFQFWTIKGTYEQKPFFVLGYATHTEDESITWFSEQAFTAFKMLITLCLTFVIINHRNKIQPLLKKYEKGLFIGFLIGISLTGLLALPSSDSRYFNFIGPYGWIGGFSPYFHGQIENIIGVGLYKYFVGVGFNGIFYALLGGLVQAMAKRSKNQRHASEKS